MTYSMTGYASVTRDLGSAVLHLELKSVNSRFLDLAFRMAEELRLAEMPLRELLTTHLARGKVDCRAYLQGGGSAPRDMTPNRALLERLARLDGAVRETLPAAAPLSTAEVLRWPGVLAEDTLDSDTLLRECLDLARQAVTELVATRAREGAKLSATLRDRVARMRELVARVEPLLPVALAAYQDRLATRLREAVAALDEDRIRQEVGVFAARIDVAEELTRLVTHLDEVERILTKPDARCIGKRLDFLMQELNREANTLASKSVSAEVTAIALDLKLLIEQMREQVQNLE